jgi:hypothetical protein
MFKKIKRMFVTVIRIQCACAVLGINVDFYIPASVKHGDGYKIGVIICVQGYEAIFPYFIYFNYSIIFKLLHPPSALTANKEVRPKETVFLTKLISSTNFHILINRLLYIYIITTNNQFSIV